MTKLIPQQRPDKNGKMVTRWVKPDSVTSTLDAIPAPVASGSTQEEAINTIEMLINDFNLEESYCAPILLNGVRQMGSHAEAFMDLFEFHAGASDIFYGVADVLDSIYGDQSQVPERHRGTVLFNYMNILPPYFEGKDNDGVYAAHFTRVLFEAIDGYGATEPYTPDEIVALTAAASVVENIHPVALDHRDLESLGFSNLSEGEVKVVIADRRSVDIFLANVDTAEVLAEALMARKTFHPDVVQQFAEHGPLGSGVL